MDDQMAYAMAELGDFAAYADCCNVVPVKVFSMAEVAKHNSPEDCWVVLHGHVYDLTKFAKGHVGGANLITDLAGKDGTSVFEASHGENVLNSVRVDCCIGDIDPASVLEEHRAVAKLRERA
ncbi:unnamed protein product [Effrenium voratum]|uniref:Cytochrome b5 heme-binding domain-containing protein n=1 Tax=Effrenium voratum TaxID=2562239 RepID=A0AA36J128_9DINO|nr:unnamed protein product [Effrenium voratum]CAJ1441152.1 unnamed protein product [Effrenium voratum]|mmetsp:Transcript_95164/g.226546  ORF Transcript_95164/g.226546 Transcript_95164/m.226546 type:complete len:122 (+) Transcript_95164:49-414(+)|eukprot:CAMPEP_0181463916 /NCGR_PEP_ID=MMETSP1110-20121109/35162_1 /TAXON_ID=174948 /ORGANISM="Symbiodinium sp., Strain CCMP421" /LENGTH=121 /DNA_ID=CAMNT_0023588631 /DNA_START=40 /DNA_END=405 /DNA_ORIENTATION=+